MVQGTDGQRETLAAPGKDSGVTTTGPDTASSSRPGDQSATLLRPGPGGRRRSNRVDQPTAQFITGHYGVLRSKEEEKKEESTAAPAEAGNGATDSSPAGADGAAQSDGTGPDLECATDYGINLRELVVDEGRLDPDLHASDGEPARTGTSENGTASGPHADTAEADPTGPAAGDPATSAPAADDDADGGPDPYPSIDPAHYFGDPRDAEPGASDAPDGDGAREHGAPRQGRVVPQAGPDAQAPSTDVVRAPGPAPLPVPVAPHVVPQQAPEDGPAGAPRPPEYGGEVALPIPEPVPALDLWLSIAIGQPRQSDTMGQRLRRSVRGRQQQVEQNRREVGLPLRPGRIVSVTSIRGGVGKTTVTALLSKAFNRYREDPVLTLEADAALGTLPVRMGAKSVRWSCVDLPPFLTPNMGFADATKFMVPLSDGGWLLPGSQGRVGAVLDVRTYVQVVGTLRRHFPVTVVDCETLPGEVARAAMDTSHARVVVAPMTAEGVESTRVVLEWLGSLPHGALATTLVVLTAHSPDATLDTEAAVWHLRETGVQVVLLPYDRHLAQGGPIHDPALGRATQDAATLMAAETVKRLASTAN